MARKELVVFFILAAITTAVVVFQIARYKL